MIRSAGALAVLLAASPAFAAPTLGPVWSDHAVIQRDRPVVVEGTAKSGETISATLGGVRATAKAAKDGSFALTFPARPASSDPITLTVTGAGSTVTAASAAPGSGAIYVGFGGSGSLTVTNGASLDAHNLYVASKTGADGTVLVTGVGSRATVAGGMVIGGSGTGALEVTGGASIGVGLADDDGEVFEFGVGGDDLEARTAMLRDLGFYLKEIEELNELLGAGNVLVSVDFLEKRSCNKVARILRSSGSIRWEGRNQKSKKRKKRADP